MSPITITFLIIIAAAILAVNIWLIIAITKLSTRNQKDESSSLLLQQLNDLSRTVDAKIGASSKEMQASVVNQFQESQKLISYVNDQMTKHLVSVAKEITQANESSKQVFSIAEQLKNLEQVLTHQKQRGNLGEASLELILSNMLPADGYKMQYLFKDGDKVDAVIKTRDGLIPVDAKFSLDNYNRLVNEQDKDKKADLEKMFKDDLKRRIDETAKYIRPKEGTLPFAFMFIPAEGIYYDLLINEVGAVKVNTRSLIDYAYNDRKVIIVSPTTFSAYLHSVLYGFKAFKVEEKALEIAKRVEELARHLQAFEMYHTKLGNTLGTVVNHYNATTGEFKKIDKDIMRITGGEGLSIEGEKLQGPQSE